jgi:hypothetical protein
VQRAVIDPASERMRAEDDVAGCESVELSDGLSDPADVVVVLDRGVPRNLSTDEYMDPMVGPWMKRYSKLIPAVRGTALISKVSSSVKTIEARGVIIVGTVPPLNVTSLKHDHRLTSLALPANDFTSGVGEGDTLFADPEDDRDVARKGFVNIKELRRQVGVDGNAVVEGRQDRVMDGVARQVDMDFHCFFTAV